MVDVRQVDEHVIDAAESVDRVTRPGIEWCRWADVCWDLGLSSQLSRRMGWIVKSPSLGTAVDQATTWGRKRVSARGSTVMGDRVGREIELIVNRLLLDVGEQERCRRVDHVDSRGATGRSALTAVWKFFESRFVVGNRETDLFNIVRATHSACGFTSGLDCRKQKPNENTNNCNDHEQFDERERSAATARTENLTTHQFQPSL